MTNISQTCSSRRVSPSASTLSATARTRTPSSASCEPLPVLCYLTQVLILSSLVESRIHRLARYYKSVGVLPPTWKFESATANTLVA